MSLDPGEGLRRLIRRASWTAAAALAVTAAVAALALLAG